MSLNRLQIQLKKEQLKKHLSIKKITQEKYDQELASLTGSIENAQAEKVADKNIPAAPTPNKPYKSLPADVVVLIDNLQQKLQEIDAQKAELSNSLQLIPKSRSAAETVNQILQLRADYVNIGDELRYVKKHGEAPAAAKTAAESFDNDEYMQSLPNDKFQLDRDIKNLKINLNHKWKPRFEKIKDLGKKTELEKKIIHGEMRLNAMEQKFNAI